MPAATARSWSVRIISRPVRSPTWASRGCEWPPNGRWRIRPSRVRSKTAPHASSSRTRSGASLAWSSAMRGLFRYLPPTIVSRKWVCHLSAGSTWPIAAATPPSAMTVWALPSRDLQTRPTLTPAALASMAARSPAPPAPMTSTSTACVSIWSSASDASVTRDPALEPDLRVGQEPRLERPDVDVGERDRDEARPGPPHVVPVEVRQPLPERVADAASRGAGEAVDPPADEVPQRVARERVAGQERRVEEEHHATEPDPRVRDPVADLPSGPVDEALDDVQPQEEQRDEGEVQHVPMEVLENEGEGRLE